MSNFAYPDVLVETAWVEDCLGDPTVRLIEAAFDAEEYGTEHVPGALPWTWSQDFQHPTRKDIPDKEGWEALLSRSGITPDTTIVTYGGQSNWYATFAFWLLKIYGHQDVRVMNGGRQKWLAEIRPMTTDSVSPDFSHYGLWSRISRLGALASGLLGAVFWELRRGASPR